MKMTLSKQFQEITGQNVKLSKFAGPWHMLVQPLAPSQDDDEEVHRIAKPDHARSALNSCFDPEVMTYEGWKGSACPQSECQGYIRGRLTLGWELVAVDQYHAAAAMARPIKAGFRAARSLFEVRAYLYATMAELVSRPKSTNQEVLLLVDDVWRIAKNWAGQGDVLNTAITLLILSFLYRLLAHLDKDQDRQWADLAFYYAEEAEAWVKKCRREVQKPRDLVHHQIASQLTRLGIENEWPRYAEQYTSEMYDLAAAVGDELLWLETVEAHAAVCHFRSRFDQCLEYLEFACGAFDRQVRTSQAKFFSILHRLVLCARSHSAQRFDSTDFARRFRINWHSVIHPGYRSWFQPLADDVAAPPPEWRRIAGSACFGALTVNIFRHSELVIL
jgi:hypothetical protein